MEMQGIQHVAERKRQQAEWQRKNAAPVDKCPRTALEAEETAKRLLEEAAKLDAQARENAELIPNIELLIHSIAKSPYQSAQRTLAMRDLENASSRLRRELGYQQLDQ